MEPLPYIDHPLTAEPQLIDTHDAVLYAGCLSDSNGAHVESECRQSAARLLRPAGFRFHQRQSKARDVGLVKGGRRAPSHLCHPNV